MSIVILFSLAASFATCYFSTPTVFGGRDQGSIATAAIYLTKYKTFSFSTPESRDLFQKYGAGRALNYPGFDYTRNGDLTTRFPKVYIAYLAVLYKLFGLKGIQYANFPPLFLFLLTFWIALKKFFSENVSFFGFLLAASFFPFLWFAKYALTEIFMLALVWAGIYFLTVSRHSMSAVADIRCLRFSLVFFALSALTRIEGIVFFALAASYILILQRKNIAPAPKNFKKYLSAAALLLLTAYVFLNYPTLLDSVKNIAKAFLPNSTGDSAPSENLYSHLARIFLSYNILAYLLLGFAGIFWLAGKFRRDWTKPEYIPVLVLFPSFFYLVSPLVSLDDPWLFRRFVFAVFPALIFYAIYFVNRFFRHKIFLYVSLSALVAANIAVSSRFLTLSENNKLLPQIEKVSQKFGPEDLILIDRLATGSGFSLVSDPLSALFSKNAVYFFNAEDLSFIGQEHYANIYLLAPFPAEKSWHKDLIKNKPFDTTVIENNFLEPSEKKWGLAQNVKSETYVGIWKIK